MAFAIFLSLGLWLKQYRFGNIAFLICEVGLGSLQKVQRRGYGFIGTDATLS